MSPYLNGAAGSYDVSNDDERFVMLTIMSSQRPGDRPPRLILVQDWFTQLLELVGS